MKFENYKVRLIRKEDRLACFELIENNRAQLEDFFAGVVSKTTNLSDTEIFIDEAIEKNSNKTYFPFVIIDTGNQQLVGFIDVKNVDWSIPKAELGYFTDKNNTGKGIAATALKLVIDYFFNDLGFVKLLLRVHELNYASRRVAEKCGFVAEGTILKDYKTTKGEIVDMVYYGKINNQLSI